MIKPITTLLLAAVLMLTAIGCAQSPANTDNAALANANHNENHVEQNEPPNHPPAQNVQAEPEKPEYTLDAAIEEKDGEYYIQVTTNLKLTDENYGGAHVEGEGHIHFILNGSLIGPILSDEPYLVDKTRLKEGDNTIKLVLAKNSHAIYGPTKELNLTN